MHIAYLTPEYPHKLCTSSGGLGTSIKNMAETLAEAGEEVSIVIYGQDFSRNLWENNIQFYFIEQKKYAWGGWYFYRKLLERKVNKLILEKNINLLESPDWTGITAFMKFRIPHVIRLNGSDAYFCKLENRPQKFKNRFFERTALKNADSIISVSDFTGRKTMEVLNLDRSYEVIPNSVDTGRFQPAINEPEAKRILYFGSLIRKKGVLELAEIFNKVVEQNPETRLVLAGRNVVDFFEKKSTLELFRKKLSLEASRKVDYLGTLPYQEVKKEIDKASVVVLPSFAEALPMTWIEAMAMEKALVTSDIGWAPEVMIDPETGFTVNPKNHELYAKKIVQLLENKELASKMAKAARKRVVRKFSTEVVAKKNIQFYQKIINQKKCDN